MPDIPSFFNKNDFFGKLLPGYLTLTLYLVLFKPGLVFSSDPSSPALSFDLLSAIVFIIGGPAIGVAFQQLHRGLFVLGTLALGAIAERTRTGQPAVPQSGVPVPSVPHDEKGPALEAIPVPGPPGSKYSEYVKTYALLRLLSSDSEKLEVDSVEAYYDFAMSTGAGFLFLGFLGVLDGLPGPLGAWILLFVPAAGIFALFGAAERKYSFLPLVEHLKRKYGLARTR